ncbi:3-methylmercaptopropionyl-CoA dehydrogenase [Pseudomonas fluorescens]|uniref:3-methylmercaptopropionyl-CoA dehydrogenase n=1 Tax=Pseudomonas fluorescens TaxID=294 RepID=A0A5E7HR11_PSEFL|nr:acyl-CoA dehydrogenase [Pseudomonas fluorescens]VVO66714.1 3-methylmercaptopropionyl-CoA dehydrogenase [Pseudomonas fluorescens]
MNPYTAPLDEIRFVLHELAGLERVAELDDAESMADSELVDAILSEGARFAREVLAPIDSVGDREGARWSEGSVETAPGFSEAYAKFIESGWNNVSISAEYGGQGLPNLISAALQEMFVSANKAFCFCPELTAFGVKALASAANESLKNEYIPKLVSGEWTATMNLTEPQAGSDVGALRTRAIRESDGAFRVFGQKIFISYGEHDLTDNIVHLVLARIPGAPEGSKGVSLFLVPKFLPAKEEEHSLIRNDVYCSGIEHKLGNHASPTCTLVYGGSGEGAKGWLVGEENKGLQAMFVMVNSARYNVGLEGVALSERAYQQSLIYAQERVQGRAVNGGKESVPIIQHPDVRRMLLSMRSQTEAMRAVAYVLAAERDIASRHPDSSTRRASQSFVDLMIPIFKGWASETGIEVTSMSIQVHGGLGYIEESGVSQPLRDVRVSAIYEGTTSIQAHDLVERKLVRDGGAALRSWLSLIHLTLSQLNSRNDERLRVIERNLRVAVEALQGASEWILARYPDNPAEMLGGSVSFLRLCGVIAGGWQMARAALIVSEKPGDSEFARRKIHSAQFYAAHILPQAAGLALVAKEGGASVMDLGGAAF